MPPRGRRFIAPGSNKWIRGSDNGVNVSHGRGLPRDDGKSSDNQQSAADSHVVGKRIGRYKWIRQTSDTNLGQNSRYSRSCTPLVTKNLEEPVERMIICFDSETPPKISSSLLTPLCTHYDKINDAQCTNMDPGNISDSKTENTPLHASKKLKATNLMEKYSNIDNGVSPAGTEGSSGKDSGLTTSQPEDLFPRDKKDEIDQNQTVVHKILKEECWGNLVKDHLKISAADAPPIQQPNHSGDHDNISPASMVQNNNLEVKSDKEKASQSGANKKDSDSKLPKQNVEKKDKSERSSGGKLLPAKATNGSRNSKQKWNIYVRPGMQIKNAALQILDLKEKSKGREINKSRIGCDESQRCSSANNDRIAKATTIVKAVDEDKHRSFETKKTNLRKRAQRVMQLLRIDGRIYSKLSKTKHGKKSKTLVLQKTEPSKVSLIHYENHGNDSSKKKMKVTKSPRDKNYVRVSKNKLKLRRVSKRKKRLKGPRFIYCPIYCHTGHCPRRRTCRLKHDPTKRAVCGNWLLGKCNLGKLCRLQHQKCRELMPTCLYNLYGKCTKKDCPYMHSLVRPEAPYCAAFLRGYCAAGALCADKHFTLKQIKEERRLVLSQKKNSFSRVKSGKDSTKKATEKKIGSDNEGSIRQTKLVCCKNW